MRYKLKDNAIDSMQIAIENFNKWLQYEDEAGSRYLKITILFLHHAVELILKIILMEIDVKCIYKKADSDYLERLCREATTFDIPLDEYLLGKNIQTVEFNKLIELYQEKCILKYRTKKAFDKLAQYRNGFVHFGTDIDELITDLYPSLYEVYKWIVNDIYDDLLENDDYFSFYDVLDTYEPWIEIMEKIFMAEAYYNPKLKIAPGMEMIRNVINSTKFNKFAEVYGMEVRDDSDYEANKLLYKIIRDNKIVEIENKYDPIFNYTVICTVGDDKYSIYFVLMHSEGKICLYNAMLNICYFEDECDSIYEGKIREVMKIKPLTENNIRNCLIDRMKEIFKLS